MRVLSKSKEETEQENIGLMTNLELLKQQNLELEQKIKEYQSNYQFLKNEKENLQNELKKIQSEYIIQNKFNKDIYVQIDEKQKIESLNRQIKHDLQKVSKKYDNLKKWCFQDNLGCALSFQRYKNSDIQ
ncbi:hypothetical protein PPERSA_04721 [Pseudocohnilembus persalinus]|uniref:Uncharacterized protein n=1 Tax=Pseudocohnilembus persalinus TaxID=266149 RepID=A0A0V0R4L4_PSEPJ|nr:hypothetical protein PPERSA_04721 [Pseudocohnilembus persalinus]|eukprot:KRX09415.1 hypothetical protein PPERSA_04721 [Pseudocohnilembus persalinus]